MTNALFAKDQSGAFYEINYGSSVLGSGTQQSGVLGVAIDASRSSSVYGASEAIQPPSIQLLPCIKT